MIEELTLSDYFEIRNIAFEWVQSYDNKDWDRLRQILAPSINFDFRTLQGALHENISPDEYIAILSGPKLLGDKRLRTQHLTGAKKWDCLSEGTVEVQHQIRVAHQRYADESLSEVVNKGHAHGVTTHWYEKIKGRWKLNGVSPRLEWSKYDLFGTLDPKEEAS